MRSDLTIRCTSTTERCAKLLVVVAAVTVQNSQGFVPQGVRRSLDRPLRSPAFSNAIKINSYVEENDAVVCSRGVCVVADDDSAKELCFLDEDDDGKLVGMTCVPNASAAKEERSVFSVEFLWPRALLLGVALLYGTNFPLGRVMNEALPASATTSGRMLLAFVTLSPFLFNLKPEIRETAMLSGCACALGYLSQSVALVDTPAATVAFLGCLAVIVTPAVSFFVDEAKLGWKDAPQTWLAAILCLLGVAALEIGGSGGLGDVGPGDFWAALQAVGFGLNFYFCEKMMAKEPDQALPVTAVQIGVTAFFSAIWAALDGTGVLGAFGGDHGAWLLNEAQRTHYALPGLFLAGFGEDETLKIVAIAAVWTGVVTTAINRACETKGLAKVSSSEAAVLVSTEPLWAAVFAGVFLGESMGVEDIVGGALIVGACLMTTVKPQTLQSLLGIKKEENNPGFVPVGVESVNSAGLAVRYMPEMANSTVT